MIVVVEFSCQVCLPDGHPSGSCRGWLSDEDPDLAAVLSVAREVARVSSPEEAADLCA